MVTEFAVLVLLAASSVSASWLLGIRSFWLHLPVGLSVVTLLRALTFSTLNLVDQRAWLNPVFFAELFVILLLAAWFARPQMYQAFLMAVVFSILSVLSTRGLGMSTSPRADSLWILTLTKLFNATGDLNKLDRITAIRKGFSYPLMLSLGPQNEYLSAFTPFAYLVLLCALVWAVTELTKLQPKSRVLLTSAMLLLPVATAIMPLRIMYYIGPHSLVAIGYTMAAVAVALAVRDGKLSSTNRTVILLGFALAAISTAEALAVLLVIAIALFKREWLKRSDTALLTLAASVPFAIWLATYNSYLIQVTGLVWYVACPLFIGLLLLIATKPFDAIRQNLSILVPIGLVVFLIGAHFAYPQNMTRGYQSLVENLFFGKGDWGALPYVILFGIAFVILTGISRQSHEVRSLIFTVVVAILSSMVAKILAGGQLGDPLLGRFAWTDSLNRMWFHILGISLIAIVVGITQQDWLWSGRKSGKLVEAKPYAKANS